jgi:hypothetical protein
VSIMEIAVYTHIPLILVTSNAPTSIAYCAIRNGYIFSKISAAIFSASASNFKK